MPDLIRLVDDIRFHEADAQRIDRLIINFHGIRALLRVIRFHLVRDHAGIDQHIVNDSLARMIHDCLGVHRSRIAIRFSRLAHHIADIDLDGAAVADGLRHAFHQQIRHHARIEAPRPQNDRVRLTKCLERRLHRLHLFREQMHPLDALMCLRDLGLSLYHRPILHRRVQAHMLLAGGQHPSLDCKNLRRLLQGSLHISRDLIHRCEKKIPEAVSRKRVVALEPVLEQLFHQRLRIRQCHKAVAEIPRRDDAQILAQPPR